MRILSRLIYTFYSIITESRVTSILQICKYMTMSDKYSLLMHRIKIKSPAILFYGTNKTFLWVDLSFFNQFYSGGIATTKNLPDIGSTTIQDVALAVMRAAMKEAGVHTMSDELILQISCNIFLAF